MKWDNLKSMLCPKNGAILTAIEGSYVCSSPLGLCDFVITNAKFDELVGKMYAPRKRLDIVGDENNASALNNLGHERRSDDYSDSY